jgi:hypothetical protein
MSYHKLRVMNSGDGQNNNHNYVCLLSLRESEILKSNIILITVGIPALTDVWF